MSLSIPFHLWAVLAISAVAIAGVTYLYYTTPAEWEFIDSSDKCYAKVNFSFNDFQFENQQHKDLFFKCFTKEPAYGYNEYYKRYTCTDVAFDYCIDCSWGVALEFNNSDYC